jgi:hypothetical protein
MSAHRVELPLELLSISRGTDWAQPLKLTGTDADWLEQNSGPAERIECHCGGRPATFKSVFLTLASLVATLRTSLVLIAASYHVRMIVAHIGATLCHVSCRDFPDDLKEMTRGLAYGDMRDRIIA